MNKPKQKLDLATYNVLGLDLSVISSVTDREEQRLILEDFSKFILQTDERFDKFLHRSLYGNLDRLEAEDILRKYRTTEEGKAHIPGILSDKEWIDNKLNEFIIPLIHKIEQLTECGRTNKLYQSDFINIKRKLLDLLFKQFGCHLDLDNFQFTIRELAKISIIPEDYSFNEMVQYCALGRWH